MEKMDPPASERATRSEDWRNRVKIMQANPGDYYKVGNYSPGVATHIRRGQYAAFLDKAYDNPDAAQAYMSLHWHVTTRKTDDGARNDVFIKWLG